MNICKTCGCEHDGSYGSGIFCSKHCRYVYIGKQNKHPVCNFPNYIKKHNPDKIINQSKPIEQQLEQAQRTCLFCNKICKSKKEPENENENGFFFDYLNARPQQAP